MRRKFASLAVLLGVVAAGCGSGHANSSAQQLAANPQVKADQARAEKILKGCEPSNVIALFTSKSARAQYKVCVKKSVPPAQRAALSKCVTNGLISAHFPTKGRVEKVVLNCVGQVR